MGDVGGRDGAGDRVIPAYVVSLPSAERRRSKTRETLGRLGIPHRFVDAIDGGDEAVLDAAFVCSESDADRCYIPRPRAVSPRELACALSHCRAVRAAHDAALDAALVVEDDVDFLCRDARALWHVVDRLPADAAYLQLQIVPPPTIDALQRRLADHGELFARKRRSPPCAFADPELAAETCHGAAAYVITRAGMENVRKRFTGDGAVVFPCSRGEVASNMALVADKFVYWAATSDVTHGYVCTVPLCATDAIDSYLHEDHLPEHRVAREKSAAAFETCSGLLGVGEGRSGRASG